MKYSRYWMALTIFGLLIAVGTSIARPDIQEVRGFSGGSYLTVINSAGNFASRSVITLHADRTLSVIDSGQEGPTYFFSSQLGSWKPDGSHNISAKTVDFSFPGSGVVRADYSITFARDRSQIEGTITVMAFPLQDGNPIEGTGTLIGTFTFFGEMIRP